MSATQHSRTTFTHRLHGKIRGGSITLHITRSEAADIIKKWSAALKRSQRGHRTYFIMHCHKGLPYDRLIVETHHHVARKRSADEAKPWVTR
jgi:hypothetical protein